MGTHGRGFAPEGAQGLVIELLVKYRGAVAVTSISGGRLAGCCKAILCFPFGTEYLEINSFFKHVYWGSRARCSGGQLGSQTAGTWRMYPMAGCIVSVTTFLGCLIFQMKTPRLQQAECPA